MTRNGRDLPPATVVICSRNRPHMLQETIESVLAGRATPHELLVVDQSDVPHPILATRRPERVSYRWTRSRGLSCARNLGASLAACPLLAFIDDDMWVADDWYEQLVNALVEAGPKTVVTGRVLPGHAERRGGYVPSVVTAIAPRRYAGRIGTDVLAGGHCAMFRSTWEHVGPFDERLGAGTRLPAAEDNDFGFRLLEAGYTIVYAPEAVVFHRAWRDESSRFAVAWSYGRGKGGFFAKYVSIRDPYILGRACRDAGWRLLRFPWRLVHRPRLALGDLVYVAGMLSGAVEWVVVSTRTQASAS